MKTIQSSRTASRNGAERASGTIPWLAQATSRKHVKSDLLYHPGNRMKPDERENDTCLFLSVALMMPRFTCTSPLPTGKEHDPHD